MIASAIARNARKFQTDEMTTHPIDRLFALIASRKDGDPSTSYTAKLLARGRLKCAQKLGEEAVETCLAAVAQDKTALTNEIGRSSLSFAGAVDRVRCRARKSTRSRLPRAKDDRVSRKSRAQRLSATLRLNPYAPRV